MNYELLLRERSLKVTPQRLGILSLMELKGHISIEDMFFEIRKNFKSISLATLYKNLHAMVDVALVKEIKLPNQKSKYEVVKEPHSHLLCTCCGDVKDIVLDTNELLSEAQKKSSYKLSDTEITLSGLCDKCA